MAKDGRHSSPKPVFTCPKCRTPFDYLFDECPKCGTHTRHFKSSQGALRNGLVDSWRACPLWFRTTTTVLGLLILLYVPVLIATPGPSDRKDRPKAESTAVSQGSIETPASERRTNSGLYRVKVPCCAARDEKEIGICLNRLAQGDRETLHKMHALGLIYGLRVGDLVEMVDYRFSRNTCKIRIRGEVGYWWVPSEYITED